jgi:predicted TIM-barrel fold metal-dependent hydrolase
MILFPSMHGYDVGGGETATALDFAADHNMIVCVHFGAPRIEARTLIGLDPGSRIDHGNPKDLIPAAQSRADSTFTVPYSGGDQLEEFLGLGDSCPNVYANIVGSGVAVDDRKRTTTLADVFSETRRAYGIQRILYGSDSGGFSQGYREDVLEAQIVAMIEAGFTDVARAAVLGGNASQLPGLT